MSCCRAIEVVDKLWQREQDYLLQPKGRAIQVLIAAEELPQEKCFDLKQNLTN